MDKIPARMTHFHGADRDTGASTVFHVISEEYVQWLEENLRAFIQQARAAQYPELSSAFATKAFENLSNWYTSEK